MQKVIYGKKNREIKVPVNWAFLKDKEIINAGDKMFNDKQWTDVPEELVGTLPVSENIIVIRSIRGSNGSINSDPHVTKQAL